MYADVLYIGPDPATEGLWTILFKHHQIFDFARGESIYFTIVSGEAGCYALVVTNRGTSQMSRKYWEVFRRSLSEPCQINEAKGEIQFPERKITLNINNLLHMTAYKNAVIEAEPDRLVRQYYKSGLVLTWSVGISTYGESVDVYERIARRLKFEGSIERHEGFRLEFLVEKRRRKIDVLPSVINTWPIS